MSYTLTDPFKEELTDVAVEEKSTDVATEEKSTDVVEEKSTDVATEEKSADVAEESTDVATEEDSTDVAAEEDSTDVAAEEKSNNEENSIDKIVKIEDTFNVNEKVKTTTKLFNNQIYIDFENNAVPINCIISASNTKYSVLATNKELRLLQNRFYFIPITPDNIDSDNFRNIKIFSDMADQIDIRYIKDGLACIRALKHNILIKDKQRLCSLV